MILKMRPFEIAWKSLAVIALYRCILHQYLQKRAGKRSGMKRQFGYRIKPLESTKGSDGRDPR